MLVPKGAHWLENVGFSLNPDIQLADMIDIFNKGSMKVFANGKLIADAALLDFASYHDWHRFELEYRVNEGDKVTAELCVDDMTTRGHVDITASITFRGEIEINPLLVGREKPHEAMLLMEAK